jgi:phthalate 4,5-dioxygenase
MGPIADRSHERLGASDIAIVQSHCLMLDGVQALQEGQPPLGISEPHTAQAKLRSFEGIVPKTVDWRTLGVSAEELTQYPRVETNADISVPNKPARAEV